MRTIRNKRLSIRRLLAFLLVAVLMMGGLFAVTSSAAAVPAANAHSGTKPTIVLVHGAFADASGWNGVVDQLEHKGYTVVAPANPLRGIAYDSAYPKATSPRSPDRSCSPATPTGAPSSRTPPTVPGMSSDWSTSQASPRTKGNDWPT